MLKALEDNGDEPLPGLGCEDESPDPEFSEAGDSRN
jgi:hypothetical protein